VSKPEYKVGDITPGGYEVIAEHAGSGGYVARKDLQVIKADVKVFASEQFVLIGAMAGPSWDVYLRVACLVENVVDDGFMWDVTLFRMSEGQVTHWMCYDTDDIDKADGSGDNSLFGTGASPQFSNQEERLKFLTKFGMGEDDFNELNPPWRDLMPR
jgi:hypothetical protein